MIASLRGKVSAKLLSELIIDVGGVGYRLLVPSRVLAEVSEGSEVTLHTYLYVHDNRFQLHGFCTPAERELFEKLISVSGIGPRVAINLLSAFSSEELRKAVVAGSTDVIASVPGIGRKTAQRLVLELKEKLGMGSDEIPAADEGYGEAHRALLELGYSAAEASAALKGFPAECNDGTVEAWLRHALGNLGSKGQNQRPTRRKKVSRA